jgi:hypothetical protein
MKDIYKILLNNKVQIIKQSDTNTHTKRLWKANKVEFEMTFFSF